MTIWLYCVCRNEEPIIPYLLRHYEGWVDKMIFYDAGSTDCTQDLIKSHPKCELRKWPGSDCMADDEMTCFANHQWRESVGVADWCIFIDADEFLYHPDILTLLELYLRDGVEVPRITGYTMLSRDFPKGDGKLTELVKTGVEDECWAKNAIFRNQIYWNVGKHSIDTDRCNPKMSYTAAIKLLHYRGLGMDYVRQRHDRNWNRVPEDCRAKSYGLNCDPSHQGHHNLGWFEERINGTLTEVI